MSFTALLGVIPFCSRANRFNSASFNKAFLNLLLLDTMALATFINLSSPIPSIVLVKLWNPWRVGLDKVFRVDLVIASIVGLFIKSIACLRNCSL